MKRPRPTKQLIIEVSGGNQPLIERVHHGLYETSLGSFYPWLNFDEVIAFELGSWDIRSKRSPMVVELADVMDIYDIFSNVFRRGFPWLNRFKNVSDKLKRKHEEMNPFERNLRNRLEQVDIKDMEILKKKLMKKANEYVFECNYYNRKRERGGDNYKLVNMAFQNVYPKKGKIVPAFASEIVRLMKNYPTEYELL